MSCDLNLRGVKRKLEPLDSSVDNGVESGVESSLCNTGESDSRRVRFDNQSSALSSPEEDTSTCPASTVPSSISPTPPVSNSDQFFRPLFVPSPASSDSMSDDDDDDDDSEDDEDVFLNNHLDDSYGLTNADSESSYEDRALSSSLSDSSSSSLESEFSTMMPSHLGSGSTSLNGSLYSSSIDATSFPGNTPDGPYSSQPTSLTAPATSSRNTSDNGYYCAYSAPSSGTTNLSKSSHYQDLAQQSYLQANNVSSTLPASSGQNQSNFLRQRVFHLSMFKWSRFRQSADPCLHKSVMICNTLRMLEKELEREGVKINFSPNGVSFISPVRETPEIEVLPILPNSSSSVIASLPTTVSSLAPSIPPGCSLSPFPHRSSTSTLSSDSGLYPYQPNAPCDMENCPGYEKYFSMERSSASGRVTPFVRPTTEEYSNRSLTSQPQTEVSESNSQNSSGFWGSNGEETMSDRLTNFNWSNMFNSTSPSASANDSLEAVNGDLTTSAPVQAQASPGTQANSSESSLASSGLMSYSSMPEQSQSAMLQSSESSEYSSTATCTGSLSPSQCNSSAPPTTAATFATLLPPASTLTMSTAPMEPISSASSVSDSSPYTTSFYSTKSSGQSMYSSSIPSGGGSTTSVNGLMCSTGSYPVYTGASETEMFGDIDLSQYDFDLIPEDLSPPNAPSSINKTIISAEELILSITSCGSSDSCALNTCTTVNSFSGLSYTSSASSASSYTNGPVSNGGVNTASSGLHHQLTIPNGMVNGSLTSSSQLNNCGTTSSVSSGLHLHTASGRFYKTSEERDQQAITTIKCHN